MKKILIISCLMFMAAYSSVNAQQNDSIWSYSYECNNCGTFKTFSAAPIELTTQVSITSEVLPDTSTNIFAQFSSTSLRKNGTPPSNIFKHHKNIFNVYPNPAKNTYFVYIESSDNGLADIQLTDIYGRALAQSIFNLKKGINVHENSTSGLSAGNYYIRVKLQNEIFVKKILIEK